MNNDVEHRGGTPTYDLPVGLHRNPYGGDDNYDVVVPKGSTLKIFTESEFFGQTVQALTDHEVSNQQRQARRRQHKLYAVAGITGVAVLAWLPTLTKSDSTPPVSGQCHKPVNVHDLFKTPLPKNPGEFTVSGGSKSEASKGGLKPR